MDNKKLKFIKEKNTLPTGKGIKFIFTGNKKGTKMHMKYALKTAKFKQKQPQERRSLDVGVNHGLHTRPGIGLYPVPTGRILRTYAKDHGLLPLSKKEIQILKEAPLTIKRKDMTYDQLISSSKKRYMDPFDDADGDGVVNTFDCRPLNKNKQHVQLDPEEYDIKGNTLPSKASKSQKMMDNTDFMPVKGGKITVDVPVKQQEIETYEEPEEDQVGWKKEGSQIASKNITKITKRWKDNKD
jgi:hypothetical protein